jgi:hypothetical protein
MDWQVDAAIATIFSSVTIVASALFVVMQLCQAARHRYFAIIWLRRCIAFGRNQWRAQCEPLL